MEIINSALQEEIIAQLGVKPITNAKGKMAEFDKVGVTSSSLKAYILRKHPF